MIYFNFHKQKEKIYYNLVNTKNITTKSLKDSQFDAEMIILLGGLIVIELKYGFGFRNRIRMYDD